MPTRNELSLLERRLGEQLGWNPFGEPMYKWVRAGNHMLPFLKTDGFGNVQHRMKEINGITVPFSMHPVVEMQKSADWLLDDQWVLVCWLRVPKEQWDENFRQCVPWPSRGVYYATNAALDPGEQPNDGNTDEVIQAVLKDRRMSYQDWIDQTEKGLALEEKHKDSRIDDILRDTITAFGSAKPGSRGGHYTPPPTREYTANYDAAVAAEKEPSHV